MKIKIKTSNEAAFELETLDSNSILLLKQQIQSHFDDDGCESYRLIYAGKVLKDEQLVEECKIKEGNTIHLVRGQKAAAKPAQSSATSTPQASSQPAAVGQPAIPQQQQQQTSPFNMFGNNQSPFSMGPTGMGAGMPGMGAMDPAMVLGFNLVERPHVYPNHVSNDVESTNNGSND